MAPKTAKRPIPRKCTICGKKLCSREALVHHIDSQHASQIPEGWSASRYENFLRSGMEHGTCIVCGEDTGWNEKTWKYNRICKNPACKKQLSDKAKANMKKKYGKEHLLDDPDMQRKMIYSKTNSGTYYFSDDTEKKYPIMYASSEEKRFLEMLDIFLDFDPVDVIGPSPNTYKYTYEKKTHFYIPDYYIPSLNLEIEIKEPKDNQNQHPKIQAVDKVKERLKDEMMDREVGVDYLKINGSDYSEFFAVFSALKEADRNTLINTKKESVTESVVVTETDDLADVVNRFNDLAKNAYDLENPKVTYDDLIKRLNKDVNTCGYDDIPYVENELMQVKNRLYETSLRKPQEKNGEAAYEAKKAYNIIVKEIEPRFQRRKEKLIMDRKKGKKTLEGLQCYVEEGTNFTGIKGEKIFKPVFVVLSFTGTPMGKAIKAVTKQPYSHAALSFDTELKDMVSFGFSVDNPNGFGFVPRENIRGNEYSGPGKHCAVYMYLASLDEYQAMVSAVDNFREHMVDFKYSFRGLFDYLLKREKTYSDEYFCSEFVVDILKIGNINLTRASNHYSPGDLEFTHKLRRVYKGTTDGYDVKKVDKEVRKVLLGRGFQSVTIK